MIGFGSSFLHTAQYANAIAPYVLFLSAFDWFMYIGEYYKHSPILLGRADTYLRLHPTVAIESFAVNDVCE